ncbi:hypothetical protein OUZ56_022410 [Daphnia magna]|uniref:Uncharacterized protein n=1 Tax=Daphnia magna TaxID=35525 RepID=A0ABR0AWB1_9CRUS|nr:hypothetical protein OUZ56_022410 [Daphnia magna]
MRAQPAGINPFKNFLEDNVQKLKAAVLLTNHSSLEKKSPNMFTAVLPCDAAVLVPVSMMAARALPVASKRSSRAQQKATRSLGSLKRSQDMDNSFTKPTSRAER